jgi:hypothetical protein
MPIGAIHKDKLLFQFVDIVLFHKLQRMAKRRIMDLLIGGIHVHIMMNAASQ